jgi:erythromycin esterase
MKDARAAMSAVLWVECLKLRRSPALMVALGTPFALSALLCLSFLLRPEIADGPYWSWRYFFQTTRAFWGVFILPALLAAMAALSLDVEHRQDNWKVQLVQPVRISSLFWAKFFVLVLLVTASQAVLYGSTLLWGQALRLPGSPPAAELFIALAVIPATLPVLAFQFGLSLNLRSFLFPIGIGIFGHFVSLVSSSVPVAGVRPGYYMPWSFSLRALRVSGRGVEHPLVELAIACAMGLAILWAAQLYFTEKGRGRTRRPAQEKRAMVRRYASTGMAIAVVLILFVGMHLQQGSRVDWLREQVTRVVATDSTDDFSDLEVFGRAIGDSRVVLLGESSHGDGATLQMKSRLVRYLHQRRGFDVLAFESGLYDCLRAGEEILRGADSLEWGENSVFDVWTRSAQVRPVLEYLGESVKAGQPLQLAGFDLQVTGTVATDYLVEDLRDFLSESHPNLLTTEDWSLVSNNLGELFSDAQAWRLRGEPQYEQALAATANLEDALRNWQPGDAELRRRADFWAQSLENLHDLFRFVRALDPDDPASIRTAAPIRERAMARNLLWLVERYFPDRKIIVWGATSHLSRNRQLIDSAAATAMTPMGQELWDRLGDRSYVVGFTSFEGLSGIPRPAEDVELRDIGVAPQNSLEDLLARGGLDVAFLDLRAAEPDSWLTSEFTARPLGHTPMTAQWNRILDGLFFIRQMTPSTMVTEEGRTQP